MKNVKSGHAQPIICLDAGHYGKYNRSPAIPEYYESDMNRKLHLMLKPALDCLGIRNVGVAVPYIYFVYVSATLSTVNMRM